MAQLELGRDRIATIPLWVDDKSSFDIMDIRTNVIRWHAKHDIDAIFIDYIQLAHSRQAGRNREQEVTIVSQTCKQIARELNMV